MGVSPWIIIFLLIVLVQAFVASADTNAQDSKYSFSSSKVYVTTVLILLSLLFILSMPAASGLNGLAGSWGSAPSNWAGNDPCGDKWIGIICTGNRVTSIRLSSFGLSGTLSGDIQSLSELQYLDLSYNKNLNGPLPSTIGTLSKLQNLILVGCGFTGEIPKEIGQLSNLIFL
jgi:hypothetical protein